MKVQVYPADLGGCGHYRMIWPARAVRDKYADVVEVLIAGEDDERMAPVVLKYDRQWDGGERGDLCPSWVNVLGVRERPDCDVMVFQRPLHKQYAQMIPFLRELGVTVVIDIDDNFDRIQPTNVAWFPCEPYWQHKDAIAEYPRVLRPHVTKMTADRHWYYSPYDAGASHKQWLKAALGEANLVTFSTPALHAHYTRGKVKGRVLRNRVPESYLRLREQRTRRVLQWVGWTGSVATHPGDLDVMGHALKKVKQALPYAWEFHIVGTGVGVQARAGVPVDHSTEWVPIDQYPREFAELDIALCPLDDNSFNEGKSYLKMLEAMAVGAVPLASPSAEYATLAKLYGDDWMLCDRPDRWAGKIKGLLLDTMMQEERRERGYALAAKHTYEGNAEDWVATWMEARTL